MVVKAFSGYSIRRCFTTDNSKSDKIKNRTPKPRNSPVLEPRSYEISVIQSQVTCYFCLSQQTKYKYGNEMRFQEPLHEHFRGRDVSNSFFKPCVMRRFCPTSKKICTRASSSSSSCRLSSARDGFRSSPCESDRECLLANRG